MFGEKPVRCGALIEIERLPFAKNFDSGHGDFDERRIEFHAGAARCGKDAAPIGIGAGKGGFHKRRSGDGFRDFARGGFCSCSANFDLDHALSAFAVGDDLLRERTADFFERRGKLTVRFAAVRNGGSAGGAVCENEQRVVRRSVAVHADGVEGARSNVAKSTLQQGGRNGGVSYHESERSGHIRMNHARAFGTPD